MSDGVPECYSFTQKLEWGGILQSVPIQLIAINLINKQMVEYDKLATNHRILENAD